MTHSPEFRFSINYTDCDNYLHAFVSGEKDSVDVSLAYWETISTECRKRGYSAVLIEENFPNQGSALDIYAIASQLPELGTRGLRIAFVDTEPSHNDLNMFGETVSVNRGFHGRVFVNREDAVAWLTSS